jgi:hypothetical protein
MKFWSWQVGLGIGLLAASALVYVLHFVMFRDAHHIFIYLVGDIAFVFIEILLVAMIFHRVLEVREKRARLHKLNMIIGSFFSNCGTDLLARFVVFDGQAEAARQRFKIDADWDRARFVKALRAVRDQSCQIDVRRGDVQGLKDYLAAKREQLLRILENPNMLEHATFSELMWAILHLEEELSHRRDLSRFSDLDAQHLAGDVERAYLRLRCEWLAYLLHLQQDYPYLFSLARRRNPFDPEARVAL